MFYNRIDKFLFGQTHFLNKNSVVKLISFFCIINLIVIVPDMYEIYGYNGLITQEINNSFLSWYQPRLDWFTNPLTYLGLGQNGALLLVFIVYLLSLLFVFFGTKRVTFSLIGWVIHLMMVNSSYMFSYGADYFISFALFVNVIICFSYIYKEEINIALYSFVIRFIQVHMCLVYFFAGFGKILGKDWFDGNGLWMVLNSYAPEFVNNTLPLLDYPWVYKVLSLTVLLELVYPIFIYMNKTRKWMFLTVVLLHISIALFMGLYTFAGIMILLNYTAFGHYFNLRTIKLSSFKKQFLHTKELS